MKKKGEILKKLPAVLAVLVMTLSICLQVISVQAAEIDLADGMYTIELSMEGGTGKASITSPAVMTVEDGCAYVQIEWSSPYYDYMIVDEEMYYTINEDGNSVFEIPVLVFDEEMTVIGDTTAMSEPHEIEYTLVFDTSTIVEYEDASDEDNVDVVETAEDGTDSEEDTDEAETSESTEGEEVSPAPYITLGIVAAALVYCIFLRKRTKVKR